MINLNFSKEVFSTIQQSLLLLLGVKEYQEEQTNPQLLDEVFPADLLKPHLTAQMLVDFLSR